MRRERLLRFGGARTAQGGVYLRAPDRLSRGMASFDELCPAAPAKR